MNGITLTSDEANRIRKEYFDDNDDYVMSSFKGHLFQEMTIHNITTVAIALIGFLSMVTLLYVNVHYHVPKKAFTAILTSSLTVSYFIAPLYHSIAYDRVCNRVSEQYENILRDN